MAAKKTETVKISKQEFDELELKLHTDLLNTQRKFIGADFPVIVIVSGVEAAGKSAVVNRLNKWLDARGVKVSAFWDESDEERERPVHWRFWRSMPPKGSVGIFFGSWYTQPIIRFAKGDYSPVAFRNDLKHINGLERMLADDGALIIKFWFDISRKEQARRLKRKRKKGHRITPWEKQLSRLYDQFKKVTTKALAATNTEQVPWHVVDATDPNTRDLEVGRILLEGLKKRLARKKSQAKPDAALGKPGKGPLDKVDLGRSLTQEKYKQQLKKYQARLAELHWAGWEQKRSTVLLFEGWDAAGKGGAIRRCTAAMDARLYQVIPVAAPTDEERQQHYLWRFWRHIPRAGYVTMYDRTWYGRVLVERLEGFATHREWVRAYDEINEFEYRLSEHGIALAKFWVHLSPEEQLRRFELRSQTPHKAHKLTDEDWRNREKWDDYSIAVNEMIERTNKKHAPWFVIPGDDKLTARVEILKAICRQMEKTIKV